MSGRVFAVAGWRYEPEWLVEEMRRNLAWCHRVVVVDDRARDELWIHEAEYRELQRAALIAAGIRPWDWVLTTSPDERWSSDAAYYIPRLARLRHMTAYQFPLREMWTATQYRYDGMWSRKRRARLYPFLRDQEFSDRRIQTQPVPVGPEWARRRNMRRPVIYHLECIDPASRVERAIVYEALGPGSREAARDSDKWRRYDPDGEYMCRYGYAYLADPRGARLRPLPAASFKPAVTRPYEFRVPDRLLEAECGMSRADLTLWLTSTLGLPMDRIIGAPHG